jgi:hypothetical protein
MDDDVNCLLILKTAVGQYSNRKYYPEYTIGLSDVYVIQTDKTRKYFNAVIKTTVNDNLIYGASYEFKTGNVSIRVYHQIDKLVINKGEFYV